MASINDPICFARDENNDRIVPGRLARGLEAVLILIRTRLLLWRGEWFLDRTVGMPWLETPDELVPERDAILGQPFDAAKVSRAVRGQILAVPHVIEVPELACTFDRESRAVSVTFRVRTLFGDSDAVTVALAA